MLDVHPPQPSRPHLEGFLHPSGGRRTTGYVPISERTILNAEEPTQDLPLDAPPNGPKCATSGSTAFTPLSLWRPGGSSWQNKAWRTSTNDKDFVVP